MKEAKRHSMKARKYRKLYTRGEFLNSESKYWVLLNDPSIECFPYELFWDRLKI